MFTMNPDGSDARQLTPTEHNRPRCSDVLPSGSVSDIDPSFSPTGKRLAFTYRFDDPYETTDYISMIRADGTNPHFITKSGTSSQPAFSPDDKKIVFSKADSTRSNSGSAGISMIRTDGTYEHPITDETGSALALAPTFFPDGTRILFVSFWSRLQQSRIFTVRLDGSDRHGLTPRSSPGPFDPDVSPDGRRVVFGRGTGIYVMRADGTHTRRLADGYSPVSSPNGKRIAFFRGIGNHREIDNYREIAVMQADGSGQHSVIPNPLPFGVSDPSELALGGPTWAQNPCHGPFQPGPGEGLRRPQGARGYHGPDPPLRIFEAASQGSEVSSPPGGGLGSNACTPSRRQLMAQRAIGKGSPASAPGCPPRAAPCDGTSSFEVRPCPEEDWRP